MRKIHFIGIGGIGISASARFLKEKGYEISGSDLKPSKITKKLESEGVRVFIPHGEESVCGRDLIIYSAAIEEENKEFKHAKALGTKCLSGKEALPLISKDKKIFAVTGAHGKSTTSSILTPLFDDASVIIGTVLKEFGSNVIYKESKGLVFKANESDSSFLNSDPYLAIVTNIEAKYLEHYNNDLSKLHNAYANFLNAAKMRVINAEDHFLRNYKSGASRLYPSLDIKNVSMQIEDYKSLTRFELKDLGQFSVFGMDYHLALDASLAIMAALEFEDVERVRLKLKNYQGTKKCFDILHADEDLAIIDDYEHHPTETKATLSAAKEYAKLANYSKITAIFEPHRYTRLVANLKHFREAFSEIDALVILPVYATGEGEIEIDLKTHFPKALLIDDIKREGKFLVVNKGELFDNGLIIGFGAGDISVKLRAN